jgi:taurine dioxygenase
MDRSDVNEFEQGFDLSRNGALLDLTPLAPALGARIMGVDLSKTLDPSLASELRQAWLDFSVLLLRDQSMDDESLVRLTHEFGELEIPPPLEYGVPYIADHPEVMIISNVVEGGRTLGSLGNGEAVWHTDLNFMEKPPAASFLYAIEVPDSGGETSFASMYEAFNELPKELARRIADRKISHDAGRNSAGEPRLEQRPPVEHPIVRIHPETNRQCLYLGRRADASIVGLPQKESDALLDALWEHAVQEKFTWTQSWRPGDLLIWDNRCTMHRRDSFDPSARRILHRTQTRGTRPYA